jgi:hypothetical protein
MPAKQELVPWTALPEPNNNVTWGDNSKAHILNLMQDGKTVEEIAAITRNRLAFVKATIHRALNPQESRVETPPEQPAPKRSKPNHKTSIACKQCGNLFGVFPSEIAKGKRFCSKLCFDKSGARTGRRPAQ